MIEDLWYKNTVIYSLDLETFMEYGYRWYRVGSLNAGLWRRKE
jgi:hypothetical protein